jgi:hypothetical protein
VEIKTSSMRRTLIALVAALGVLHLAVALPGVLPLSYVADLDSESGLGNWTSVVLLVAGAIGALLVAQRLPASSTERRTWKVFALLLAATSIDEEIMIHEVLATKVQHLLHLHGAEAYGLPIIVLALTPLVLAAARAVRRTLPSPVARRVGWGVAIVFFSQVVVEEIESWATAQRWSGAQPIETWQYHVIAGSQEILEFAGTCLFLMAIARRHAMFDQPLVVSVTVDDHSLPGSTPSMNEKLRGESAVASAPAGAAA